MVDEKETVLGGLTPFEWNDATAADCEIAVEEVNQVVGGYASLLSAAADNPAAFPETDTAAWRAELNAFVARRRALRPNQPEIIAETRSAAAAALRYLRSVHG